MFDLSPQQSQLMLLAGMILLGWILVRRQIKRRHRQPHDDPQHQPMVQRMADSPTRAVPLADAPVETLRWQAAMFDLQRELKAELDTKIAVVQALLRQADERIAMLNAASAAHPGPLSPRQSAEAQRLHREGRTPGEIARLVEAPVDDVERALAMIPS